MQDAMLKTGPPAEGWSISISTISIDLIINHPKCNDMLPKHGMPLKRKSGFPYFTKSSPYMPPGTKPQDAITHKPVAVKKLTAAEVDLLLE